MIVAAGLAAIVLGAVLAASAPRHPSRAVRLERWGGACFVGGLVLVASAFPLI